MLMVFCGKTFYLVSWIETQAIESLGTDAAKAL